MRYRAAQIIEGVALGAIALALALGGRALLAQLHGFAPAAVALLGAGVVLTSLSLRNLYLSRGADRLAITLRIAYLTGLILATWAVAAPASWNSGASIAMLEFALVFDLLSRLSPYRRGNL